MLFWEETGEVIQGIVPEEKPFDENLNTDYPIDTVGAWKYHGHWQFLTVKAGYWGKGVWCNQNSRIVTLAAFDENDPINFHILETP